MIFQLLSAKSANFFLSLHPKSRSDKQSEAHSPQFEINSHAA
jgi:hypothetical protein